MYDSVSIAKVVVGILSTVVGILSTEPCDQQRQKTLESSARCELRRPFLLKFQMSILLTYVDAF